MKKVKLTRVEAKRLMGLAERLLVARMSFTRAEDEGRDERANSAQNRIDNAEYAISTFVEKIAERRVALPRPTAAQRFRNERIARDVGLTAWAKAHPDEVSKTKHAEPETPGGISEAIAPVTNPRKNLSRWTKSDH